MKKAIRKATHSAIVTPVEIVGSSTISTVHPYRPHIGTTVPAARATGTIVPKLPKPIAKRAAPLSPVQQSQYKKLRFVPPEYQAELRNWVKDSSPMYRTPLRGTIAPVQQQSGTFNTSSAIGRTPPVDMMHRESAYTKVRKAQGVKPMARKKKDHAPMMDGAGMSESERMDIMFGDSMKKGKMAKAAIKPQPVPPPRRMPPPPPPGGGGTRRPGRPGMDGKSPIPYKPMPGGDKISNPPYKPGKPDMSIMPVKPGRRPGITPLPRNPGSPDGNYGSSPTPTEPPRSGAGGKYRDGGFSSVNKAAGQGAFINGKLAPQSHALTKGASCPNCGGKMTKGMCKCMGKGMVHKANTRAKVQPGSEGQMRQDWNAYVGVGGAKNKDTTWGKPVAKGAGMCKCGSGMTKSMCKCGM